MSEIGSMKGARGEGFLGGMTMGGTMIVDFSEQQARNMHMKQISRNMKPRVHESKIQMIAPSEISARIIDGKILLPLSRKPMRLCLARTSYIEKCARLNKLPRIHLLSSLSQEVKPTVQVFIFE